MIPKVRFGRTELEVTRIALGGYPFGGVNRARNWDPFTPEGKATAISTVHAALDAGINYIDTAPGYGEGNSESIIGEATHARRGEFALASKVGYRGLSGEGVKESVEASLKRLRTDVIDVIQFHGGRYEPRDVEHVLNEGLLDALEQLREQGKVRFLGFTAEEPWTARPLIASGRFDVVQLRYNLIYQAAALHALPGTSPPNGERRETGTKCRSSSSCPTVGCTWRTSGCAGPKRSPGTWNWPNLSSPRSTWRSCLD